MRLQLDNPDAAVAAIAASQHGVAALTQLINAGLTQSQVRNRVAAGRLHRIHRGVYAVGHSSLSNHGRWIAAVLACGPHAALSHLSAAELWRLLDPTPGEIHVTVPTSGGRAKRHGLHIHRSHLPPDTTVLLDGIRATTPARTLRDLRRVAAPGLYRRALRQAEFMGRSLEGLQTDGTRSEAEAAFLRLCRRHRLPQPAPNRRIGAYTVDFLWRDQRLVVEVDGWSSHRGKQAFEDDHERDSFLLASGYTVLRFTASQIESDSASVAALVGTKLDA